MICLVPLCKYYPQLENIWPKSAYGALLPRQSGLGGDAKHQQQRALAPSSSSHTLPEIVEVQVDNLILPLRTDDGRVEI